MTTARLAGVVPAGEEDHLLQYFYMCGVWALSTYSACDLRCSYCVSYAQGPSVPRVEPAEVDGALRRELAALPPDGVICVGALIDGYPHAEEQCGATRQALEVLVAEGRSIVIVTKGTAVARDIDLLAGYPAAQVCVSLPTLDEDALRRIEPQVASAAARIELIGQLHAAGVKVQLHVQPFIPGITDAAAMIGAVGPDVPVCFGPLNIQSPAIGRLGWVGDLTQQEINDAYVEARLRVGSHPNVTWQRPIWLGADLLDRFDAGRVPSRCDTGATGEPAAEDPQRWFATPPHFDVGTPHEHRNVAAVARMLDAFDHGVMHLIALEVLSPFVRGHDETGSFGDPDHPSAGVFRDTLSEVGAALDGARATAEALVARGDDVDAVILVSGRHQGDLLGDAPTGDEVAVRLATTYRFDRHGLIVEYWQRSCEWVGSPVVA